ncbi:MAG: hypothetical protein ACRDSI_05535 [Pseudonocardiaceae bacterium]
MIVPPVGAPAPDVDQRDQHGAPVMLLSDFWPHAAVTRAFGVLDPGGRDVSQRWPVVD